ncbi:MAG: hypothetical protein M3X11_02540 [Acidobacteriota bacterium]|nr:hypothetical protein [Acidobacteriota bacterium]
MSRSLRIMTTVALLMALVMGGANNSTVSAQTRLRRAPERYLESTPSLPAGTRVIPAGWPITLEMETPLSSATAQISDRFRARVVPSVTDDNGTILIREGTIVEGHVTAVKKAKWAHRSGYIALAFDNFLTTSNRTAPVRAILTGADVEDRKRLDEEGTIKGGNPTRRDILFIGGGAGVGAAIGVFTGGALPGGGIGAAVGLTATLLLKGKNAVVPSGQIFGMELVQPFSVSQLEAPRIDNYIPGASYGRPTSVPIPIGVPSSRPITNGISPGPLDPRDVTIERMQDGTVQMRINVETPTQGWRVYTHHDQVGTVARIRLRGVPLSRTTDSSFQTSGVAPAPLICLNDRGGTLRRAEILGRNGAVRIALDIPAQVGSRFARAQPRAVQPRPIPVNAGGYRPSNPPYYNTETSQPITVNPPIPSSTRPSSSASSPTLVQSVINQVDVIRMQYAGEIGYLREPNGNFRFIGARAPSQAQKQLLDSLGALLSSLTTLRANLGNSLTQRNSALRVQEDAQNTQRVWLQVPLSADLNSKWSLAYRDIGTLLNSTAR